MISPTFKISRYASSEPYSLWYLCTSWGALCCLDWSHVEGCGGSQAGCDGLNKCLSVGILTHKLHVSCRLLFVGELKVRD